MPFDAKISFDCPLAMKTELLQEAKANGGGSLSTYVRKIVEGRERTAGSPTASVSPGELPEIWQREAGGAKHLAATNPSTAAELNALTAATARIQRQLKEAGELIGKDAVTDFVAAIRRMPAEVAGPSMEAEWAAYEISDEDFEQLRKDIAGAIESAVTQYLQGV